MTTTRVSKGMHGMVLTWRGLRGGSALGRVRWGLVACLGLASCLVSTAGWAESSTAGRSVTEWLARMHDASRQRAYTGTLVVTAGTHMSASRIWHVCDGQQQLERIETLTGAPRTTIRRNSEVITFVPDSRQAWIEERESLGLFPALLRAPANAIPQHYRAQEAPAQRVAGHLADVVEILPKDDWRYGFRVWSEQKTGLVVKMQTLAPDGSVLEQLAFSELQLDAPVRIDQLRKQMKDTRGYEVLRPASKKTNLEAEGWRVADGVPGFQSMGCLQREAGKPSVRQTSSAGAAPLAGLQCVFSDGLGSFSLFVAPLEGVPGATPLAASMGATHSLTWSKDGYRLTALGEVPAETLQRFASSVQRAR